MRRSGGKIENKRAPPLRIKSQIVTCDLVLMVLTSIDDSPVSVTALTDISSVFVNVYFRFSTKYMITPPEIAKKQK
jgi:hypothetical protein